ncbi:hypothetical protein Bbelb_286400 [Branchiostoma belcheri]|nr:hypothetical protein Bbelb_286400 [Branchiostoma belcheri]
MKSADTGKPAGPWYSSPVLGKGRGRKITAKPPKDLAPRLVNPWLLADLQTGFLITLPALSVSNTSALYAAVGSCGVAAECATRNLEVPGSSPDMPPILSVVQSNLPKATTQGTGRKVVALDRWSP